MSDLILDTRSLIPGRQKSPLTMSREGLTHEPTPRGDGESLNHDTVFEEGKIREIAVRGRVIDQDHDERVDFTGPADI